MYIGDPITPPGCTCPQGGWWDIFPPYCPMHNPNPPSFHVVPFNTAGVSTRTAPNTTVTITYPPSIIDVAPPVDARRPEEV